MYLTLNLIRVLLLSNPFIITIIIENSNVQNLFSTIKIFINRHFKGIPINNLKLGILTYYLYHRKQ